MALPVPLQSTARAEHAHTLLARSYLASSPEMRIAYAQASLALSAVSVVSAVTGTVSPANPPSSLIPGLPTAFLPVAPAARHFRRRLARQITQVAEAVVVGGVLALSLQTPAQAAPRPNEDNLSCGTSRITRTYSGFVSVIDLTYCLTTFYNTTITQTHSTTGAREPPYVRPDVPLPGLGYVPKNCNTVYRAGRVVGFNNCRDPAASPPINPNYADPVLPTDPAAPTELFGCVGNGTVLNCQDGGLNWQVPNPCNPVNVYGQVILTGNTSGLIYPICSRGVIIKPFQFKLSADVSLRYDERPAAITVKQSGTAAVQAGVTSGAVVSAAHVRGGHTVGGNSALGSATICQNTNFNRLDSPRYPIPYDPAQKPATNPDNKFGCGG